MRRKVIGVCLLMTFTGNIQKTAVVAIMLDYHTDSVQYIHTGTDTHRYAHTHTHT